MSEHTHTKPIKLLTIRSRLQQEQRIAVGNLLIRIVAIAEISCAARIAAEKPKKIRTAGGRCIIRSRDVQINQQQSEHLC